MNKLVLVLVGVIAPIAANAGTLNFVVSGAGGIVSLSNSSTLSGGYVRASVLPASSSASIASLTTALAIDSYFSANLGIADHDATAAGSQTGYFATVSSGAINIATSPAADFVSSNQLFVLIASDASPSATSEFAVITNPSWVTSAGFSAGSTSADFDSVDSGTVLVRGLAYTSGTGAVQLESPVAIPEPSAALLALGGLAYAVVARRRRVAA